MSRYDVLARFLHRATWKVGEMRSIPRHCRHDTRPHPSGAPVDSVCPYCAVGCAQQVWVKDGQIVDIEGDPRSPINEGTLCPKGANTFQLTVNPHRPQRCLYRAPYSDHWEEKPLDWMMERIAERVKATRDATFVEVDPEDGQIVSHTQAMAELGGAVLDNEENYLIKKLLNTLGITSIENQARI